MNTVTVPVVRGEFSPRVLRFWGSANSNSWQHEVAEGCGAVTRTRDRVTGHPVEAGGGGGDKSHTGVPQPREKHPEPLSSSSVSGPHCLMEMKLVAVAERGTPFSEHLLQANASAQSCLGDEAPGMDSVLQQEHRYAQGICTCSSSCLERSPPDPQGSSPTSSSSRQLCSEALPDHQLKISTPRPLPSTSH